jgi:hypothetical protein
MPKLLIESVPPEGRHAWQIQVFRSIPGRKRIEKKWLTVDIDVWPGDLMPGCEITIAGEVWEINAILRTKIYARIKRVP